MLCCLPTIVPGLHIRIQAIASGAVNLNSLINDNPARAPLCVSYEKKSKKLFKILDSIYDFSCPFLQCNATTSLVLKIPKK